MVDDASPPGRERPRVPFDRTPRGIASLQHALRDVGDLDRGYSRFSDGLHVQTVRWQGWQKVRLGQHCPPARLVQRSRDRVGRAENALVACRSPPRYSSTLDRWKCDAAGRRQWAKMRVCAGRAGEVADLCRRCGDDFLRHRLFAWAAPPERQNHPKKPRFGRPPRGFR